MSCSLLQLAPQILYFCAVLTQVVEAQIVQDPSAPSAAPQTGSVPENTAGAWVAFRKFGSNMLTVKYLKVKQWGKKRCLLKYFINNQLRNFLHSNMPKWCLDVGLGDFGDDRPHQHKIKKNKTTGFRCFFSPSWSVGRVGGSLFFFLQLIF